MNAVIFYVSRDSRLTGSTINAIEYFLAGYEYNKNLKLILVDAKKVFKEKILNIIRDRYELECLDDFYNNILRIKRFKLLNLKLDRVLILDYFTILKTKGILNVKKILVISEKYTDDENFFFDKGIYNVTYYGEMPFHYKDIDYRMKCLFDRYKPLRWEEQGTFVNAPYYDNYDEIELLFKDILPSPMFFKHKHKHKQNLFETFTHYLYYHADKWFDPHPRLFLECTFYDKEITYYNPKLIKDGSWYRYKDIKENGIKDRKLSKDDEIIKQLI